MNSLARVGLLGFALSTAALAQIPSRLLLRFRTGNSECIHTTFTAAGRGSVTWTDSE